MNIKSFRHLLLSKLAALFAFSLLSACNLMSATNSSFEIINPLSDQGFSLIRFTDPSFHSEVAKLLSPEALLKAKDFLPLSVIVVNNTGQYIWGFTLIYTYLDRIAPVGTPWRHIISPKSEVGDHARMLGPGYAYLITPVADFGASRDASGKKSLQPYLDEGLDRMIDLFKQEHLRDRLQLSVDSMILDNGILLGPGTAKRQESINQDIQADKELLDSLKGLTGDALRNELLVYKSLDTTSPYNLYRKGQAVFFLKSFGCTRRERITNNA